MAAIEALRKIAEELHEIRAQLVSLNLILVDLPSEIEKAKLNVRGIAWSK